MAKPLTAGRARVVAVTDLVYRRLRWGWRQWLYLLLVAKHVARLPLKCLGPAWGRPRPALGTGVKLAVLVKCEGKEWNGITVPAKVQGGCTHLTDLT